MSENEKGAYGQVLKYTGIFGGVQGLNVIVSLVRNKLAALLLGPAGMGLVSLFNSTVAFISQATGFGISMSAVRHISELTETGDEAQRAYYIKVVRAWSILAALLGVLVCVAIGPFLSSNTFAWGNHTLHFILLAPAVGLIALTGGETAVLKGTRQLKPLVVVQTFTILATLVLTVPAYCVDGTCHILVYRQLFLSPLPPTSERLEGCAWRGYGDDSIGCGLYLGGNRRCRFRDADPLVAELARRSGCRGIV